jgi:hypothetical protein
MERIEISVGKRKFTCMREQLFMKPQQIISIYRQGITQINDKNTLDVSRQGDVIVHVEIE